ncbi:hypothetical protein [Fusibacter sp. JL216-2]|uniref:hypothetical protein n=1 Tax=Fusibacter sp. JL216-2 TaxID=3071453 RepID=UPI003D330491
MGFLDKTGKVLYASSEVVLGGGAAVGAVIYTDVTAGLGAIFGGGVVFAHGVNSFGNGVNDFEYIVNGEWEKVGTENYLKDNVYEPGLSATGGATERFFTDGDGSNGEWYGEKAGTALYYAVDIGAGAKGTHETMKALSKAQWTRGAFKPVNAPIQMEQLEGYKMTEELIVNFVKDAISYFYNGNDVKGEILEVIH